MDHGPAAAKSAFKAFHEAESILEAVEAFDLFKRECRAIGHCEDEPFWKALPLTQMHMATSLYTLIKSKADSGEDYRSQCCSGMHVVIVGGGPGGICTAIEASLLGADALVVEKRMHVSRNNVLKLWPQVVEYFLSLGLKSFHRQFGNTGSDKIAIRRLQLVLMKVALLCGVRLELGAEFVGFEAPAVGSGNSWSVQLKREGSDSPSRSQTWHVPCDALIGSDGEHSRVAKMAGFNTKMVQFSNAVGMTFNFKHDKTSVDEIRLKEFSRTGYFFRSWFEEVSKETGVQLENFVYYKDETHYFVMAAKPAQLIQAGILKEGAESQELLLQRSNINHEQLCTFARQMAQKVGLPDGAPFALNNRGDPDMGIFDFTKKLAATESMRIFVGDGGERPMMVKLVGDALIAPFWPLGTGCNKAVLGAHDTGFALQRYASALAAPKADRQRMHLENLAEQHTILQQLKIVISGDAKDLKSNRLPSKSCSSAPQFSWAHNPRTRYAACEASTQLEAIADLYIQNWSSPLVGLDANNVALVRSECEEPPLVPLPGDMIDAMSSYGMPGALMPPELEPEVSSADVKDCMPDLDEAMSGTRSEMPTPVFGAGAVPVLSTSPYSPVMGLDDVMPMSVPHLARDHGALSTQPNHAARPSVGCRNIARVTAFLCRTQQPQSRRRTSLPQQR